MTKALDRWNSGAALDKHIRAHGQGRDPRQTLVMIAASAGSWDGDVERDGNIAQKYFFSILEWENCTKFGFRDSYILIVSFLAIKMDTWEEVLAGIREKSYIHCLKDPLIFYSKMGAQWW